jgi:4-amino-4-deoxy-L-arabinose transferase-like glycosyltransferase
MLSSLLASGRAWHFQEGRNPPLDLVRNWATRICRSDARFRQPMGFRGDMRRPADISVQTYGWLLVAILLGLALRCFRLGQNSLWIDEYMSLTSAVVPFSQIPSAAIRDHGNNPPIYFYLLHLIIGSQGDGEIAVRLVSAIAGILTIPFAWLFARELVPDLRIANLTALLVATHPLLLWYSQEGRPYALLVLFCSAALWCLAAALRTGRAGWWIGFSVASALSMLTHVFGVVPLLVGALWCLFRWRDRGIVARYALAALGTVILSSGFLIQLAKSVKAQGTGGPHLPLTGMELPYTFFTFVAGYSFGPPVREIQELGPRAAILNHPVQTVLVGIALALLAWFALRLRSTAARDLTILLVTPLAFSLGAAFLSTKAYNVRYGLLALLGFVPLIALTLETLSPSFRRLGTAFILGLFLWADAQWFLLPQYRKEDSRGAIACLSRVLPHGSTIAVAPAFMIGIVKHYTSRNSDSLRVVGVDHPKDLSRASGTEALLLTRLHHLPDATALRETFQQTKPAPSSLGGVVGYHIYVTDSSSGRAESCPGGA